MAILEFNKFHWHLTDDQGWRFECESFPELNSKAAVRPYSDFGKKYINEPYGRVYTRDEMREINYKNSKEDDKNIDDSTQIQVNNEIKSE